MHKILIIEDDQIVANIYRNKFTVEGFQVEVALDGMTGIDLVRSYKPDAVILDLMLPKVTGVDVMKKLRGQEESRHLPIIVFSNTYLSNLVQEAWKAGATKCLSKANCSPKQVIEVVRGVLPNGKKRNEANGAGPAHGGASLASQDPDAEFQAELRQSFIDGLPATLGGLRSILQSLIKGESEMVRIKHIHELYRRVHALTGNAGLAGIHPIAHTSDALEALLKELYEKPENINPSTLRTVASTVDFLAVLFEHGLGADQKEVGSANILVVDDEAISRRAVTYALEKARLKCVAVEDSQMALKLAEDNQFDLIFLDVDMPGMNGFELCGKLRAMPRYAKTPVVFVTSLNSFESRANSLMSGGNDFICKPFLFIELAVKALVYLLRARVKTE